MSRNHWYLLAVFVVSTAVAFIITYSFGKRSESPQGEEQGMSDQSVVLVDTARIARLLSEAHDIIQDQAGPPMLGIQKYKEVLVLDSNNEAAIYQLGVLSIQSNQMEKAAERFKKLILLRPEKGEYKETYDRILAELRTP